MSEKTETRTYKGSVDRQVPVNLAKGRENGGAGGGWVTAVDFLASADDEPRKGTRLQATLTVEVPREAREWHFKAPVQAGWGRNVFLLLPDDGEMPPGTLFDVHVTEILPEDDD